MTTRFPRPRPSSYGWSRTAAPVLLCAAALLLGACSGSSDSGAGGGTPAQAPSVKTETSGRPATPEFPAGKFTVQLGAFQSEEGAAAVASLAKSRFSREVYTVLDERDGLYKVMLGVFDTKDLARSFRDTIVRQYPQEYRDAWVSELAR